MLERMPNVMLERRLYIKLKMVLERILSLGLIVGLIIIFSSCSITLHREIKLEGEKPTQKYFKVAWSKNFDPIYDNGNLPIALRSPTFHEGILLIGDSNGWMRAYTADDGRLLWSVKEQREISNTASVYQNLVLYGTVDGRFLARHYQTGELKYAVDLGDSIESPASFDDKGKVFVHLRNDKVVALDALSGKVLWSYGRSISLKTTIQGVSTPILYKNKLYVGFADGVIAAFTSDEGTLLWERNISLGNKFIDVDMTPTFHDGLLYVATSGGPLTVLNPDSGVVLRRFDFKVMRAPIFLNESLLGEEEVTLPAQATGSSRDTLSALTSSSTSTLRSASNSSSPSPSTLSLEKDRKNMKMIVGTVDGEIFLLDGYGATIKKHKLSAMILSFAYWNKKLLVITQDGKLNLLALPSLKELEVFSLGTKSSVVFGLIAFNNVTNSDNAIKGADESSSFANHWVNNNAVKFGILSSRNRLYVFDPIL